MSEAIAQKLEEACALIEKGWCQHFSRLDGQYCSFGALSVAYLGSHHGLSGIIDCDEIYRLFATVTKTTDGFSLTDWNDAPERTQAEVIQAFKKAAELARGLK